VWCFKRVNQLAKDTLLDLYRMCSKGLWLFLIISLIRCASKIDLGDSEPREEWFDVPMHEAHEEDELHEKLDEGTAEYDERDLYYEKEYEGNE